MNDVDESAVDVKPTRTKETNTKADAVLSMFDQISNDVLLSVQAKIDRRVAQKVKKLEEQINSARPIYVVSPAFSSKPVDGIQHHNFETLIRVVASGQPAMLVGPAGTGKSHAAETVAEVLGLEFFAMSVGAQTSKSDLIGYMDAMKNYVTTPFRKAYENGGLFLLDEIDAGNSNVLIQLNAALANGYMSFPDAMIRRNENFRFVASANTFGLGANRQYVGRNQLDAATLDRFVTLQWDIDSNVEEALAIGHEGPAWLEVVRMVREYVQDRELRIVVSPRATQRGSKLLAAGLDFNDVLHMALLSQFSVDEKKDLHVRSHTTWREAVARLPEVVEEVADENVLDSVDDNSVDDGVRVVPVVEPDVWVKAQQSASLANSVEEAYLTMFPDVVDREFDDATVNVAKAVVHALSTDDLRWNALKSLIDIPLDKWNEELLKQAVVAELYRDGFDFRPNLFASLTVMGAFL
jgi:MoxR-like ATPase